MYVISITVLLFGIADARVFCNDENAGPWVPLGYACQITCSTILTAIERLKALDYEYFVKEMLKNKINESNSDISNIGQTQQDNIVRQSLKISLRNDTRKNLKLFNTYHRLLTNENFADALEKEAGKMTARLTAECQSNEMATKNGYRKKFVNEKCTRKLNKRKDILVYFKTFLNNYADLKYQFDEKMAGAILETVDMDETRRLNLDFTSIIPYLERTRRYYRMKTDAQLISLQATGCLSIYLPGCFCKAGYVEDQEQCVKPETCAPDEMNEEYFQRIVLESFYHKIPRSKKKPA